MFSLLLILGSAFVFQSSLAPESISPVLQTQIRMALPPPRVPNKSQSTELPVETQEHERPSAPFESPSQAGELQVVDGIFESDFATGFHCVDQNGLNQNGIGGSGFGGMDRNYPSGRLSLKGTRVGFEKISGGNRWTKVAYAPLQFIAELALESPPDAIRFWLNGVPAHPDLLTIENEWALIDRRAQEATYQWTCPPIGKTVLQMEYQIDGHWFRLSDPLRFEVVPPLTPEPIAVGNQAFGLQLTDPRNDRRFDAVDSVTVKFANVADTDTLIADVEGYGSIRGTSNGNCCFEFPLGHELPVGMHRIAFRKIDEHHCGVSSLASQFIDVGLSYSERSEVVIDNTKSNRRLALLRHFESLKNADASNQIEWLKELMTKPIATCNLNEGDGRDASCECCSHKTIGSPPQSKWNESLEEWSKRQCQACEIEKQLASLERSQASIESSFKSATAVSIVDFDTPAVFPSQAYARIGQGALVGNLTILEGMRITASANGSYRVEFKYIAPLRPAILHLQIQFQSDTHEEWKTLTLAPIVIQSIDYHESDSIVHKVVREGHSAALERVGGQMEHVRRRGSTLSGYSLSGASQF